MRKNKITCIIVDDEKEAREGLSDLLQGDDSIEVLALCKGGIDAVESIGELKPDLLLLDIQMPDLNGFEVLQHTLFKPEVIFVTAHDEFAIKAFEYHAVDYLLKPFSNRRFFEAIERAKVRIQNKELNTSKLDALVNDMKLSVKDKSAVFFSKNMEEDRLVIKADGNLHFINTSSITWIEAFDYYIKIHTPQKFYVVRESMKRMISQLPEVEFVRIHKSHIVNLNYVIKLENTGNAEALATLKDGKILKVSRTYKNKLQQLLTR